MATTHVTFRMPTSFLDVRASFRHDRRIATNEGFAGVALRADERLRFLNEVEDFCKEKGYRIEDLELVITVRKDEDG